jgi:hypothetical protein
VGVIEEELPMRVAAVSCLAVLALGGLAAAPPAPDAAAILARAKEATGGKAWDAVASRRVRATLHTGGLDGTAESIDDVRTGSYADRFDLGPAKGAEGFDGKTAWAADASGQARAEEASEARAAAVDEAYRRALAFWYPERWPARIEALSPRVEGSRHFDLLRITPRGGRPFEIWVDAATGLFDRVVDTGGTKVLTTFLTDYRQVEGVKMPWKERTSTGEERYDVHIAIESVRLNQPVEAALFSLPAPPPADFTVAGGATAVAVPFELINNHLYVEVKLDGKGPFRVLLDTGGANVVTPEMAHALGVQPQGAVQGGGVGEKSADVGFVKLGAVELGGITLRDQLFAVFDLGSLSSVEGMPQNGLVGYEIFKRFVVRVDYEHRRLTLTLPAAFAHRGGGVVVPFKFHDQVPQVEGAIDGIAGAFDIDTGSRATLDLFGPFVEAHGLRARYAPTIQGVSGWGVGGPARGQLARAGSLRLGGLEISRPVVELTLQTKGAYSDKYVAGNVGGGLLRRFNVTFDYSRQQLIFEPYPGGDAAASFDRAGAWINLAAGDAFEVIDAYAGGPAAAAGLRQGDRIVEVDGRGPAALSLPALREHLRDAPPGTRVHLLVDRGGKRREIVVVLRDLV